MGLLGPASSDGRVSTSNKQTKITSADWGLIQQASKVKAVKYTTLVVSKISLITPATGGNKKQKEATEPWWLSGLIK